MSNLNDRTRSTPVPDRLQRRAEYAPGYQGALIRSELKQGIRELRSDYGLNDTHMERCIASACVELALRDENRARLFEFLRIAVEKDFAASLQGIPAGQAHKESREAGSVG